jgi:hypothetical protein
MEEKPTYKQEQEQGAVLRPDALPGTRLLTLAARRVSA